MSLDETSLCKEKFITEYAQTFLAVWAANNYEIASVRGDYKRLHDNSPIEDAFYIANKVWESDIFQDEIEKIKTKKI